MIKPSSAGAWYRSDDGYAYSCEAFIVRCKADGTRLRTYVATKATINDLSKYELVQVSEVPATVVDVVFPEFGEAEELTY